MSLDFVSVACNRTQEAQTPLPHIAHSYAVAAGCFVGIYGPTTTTTTTSSTTTSEDAPRVLHRTLRGHTDHVTSVQAVQTAKDNVSIVVSASVDTTIRVWEVRSQPTTTNATTTKATSAPSTTNNTDGNRGSTIYNVAESEYTCIATLSQPHSQPIVSIAVHFVAQHNQVLVASAATDGQLAMHLVNVPTDPLEAGHQAVASLVYTAKPKNIALCVALIDVPRGICDVGYQWPLLALGGTDKNISIYTPTVSEATEPQTQVDYSLAVALKGHTNWIRSIDVIHTRNDGILIASASQDKYIRVWKLTHSEPRVKDTTSTTTNTTTDTTTVTINKENEPFKIEFDPTADAATIEDQLSKVLADAGLASDDSRLSTRTHTFDLTCFQDTTGKTSISVTALLDTVLSGHEDWVHSVRWWKAPITNTKLDFIDNEYYLVSASADKTIAIWKPADLVPVNETKEDNNNDKESEDEIILPRLAGVNRSKNSSVVWEIVDRLGEVGGHTLGFYQGLLDPTDGQSIMAVGYNGSLQIWKRVPFGNEKKTKNVHSEKDGYIWEATCGLGGHFRGVECLTWDPHQNYIVTCSLDQTTRVVAPWRTRPISSDTKDRMTWHEIARPQIHGYDLHSIAFCGDLDIVSGADEKVLRVFGAPATFVDMLHKISNVDKSIYGIDSRPLAASVPALGLSNKAVFAENTGDKSVVGQGATFEERMEAQQHVNMAPLSAYSVAETDAVITRDSQDQPPTEQNLIQRTLWPETDKLYGHGHEISSVGASSDCVATACRATSEEDAVVRLWMTPKYTSHGDVTLSWQQQGQPEPIRAHKLTVTGVKFSPRCGFLLTYGRDRSVAISVRNSGGTAGYTLAKLVSKAHSRIVWDGTWVDEHLFVTVSRDKTLKVWQVITTNNNNNSEGSGVVDVVNVGTHTFNEAVTAVSVSISVSILSDGDGGGDGGCGSPAFIAAAGLEDGSISLVELSPNGGKYDVVAHRSQIPVGDSHQGPVRALQFAAGGDGLLRLASAGADHSTRVFTL